MQNGEVANLVKGGVVIRNRGKMSFKVAEKSYGIDDESELDLSSPKMNDLGKRVQGRQQKSKTDKKIKQGVLQAETQDHEPM